MRAARSDDNGTPSYDCLVDHKFLLNWVTQLEHQKILAGTVKTYLGSIQHFFHYLELNTVQGFDLDKLRTTELRVVRWKRALGRDIERQESKKNYEDFLKFITAEEVKKVGTSSVRKEAIDVIKVYQLTGTAIKLKGFCTIRDYIVTNLILDNVSRPT